MRILNSAVVSTRLHPTRASAGLRMLTPDEAVRHAIPSLAISMKYLERRSKGEDESYDGDGANVFETCCAAAVPILHTV